METIMVIRKGGFAWLVPPLLVACAGSSNESGSRGPAQAEPGDAEARYNRALSYYEGERGPADYSASRLWYERAAERGYADAQFSLARMYYDGEGGPLDYPAAQAMYERAAEEDYATAQFNLGLMYYDG
jgi:TPR repeat protein